MARRALPKNAECSARGSVLLGHRSLAGRTRFLPDRDIDGSLISSYGGGFVTVREKFQERGNRGVQKFIVDLRLDAEQLPDLSILECNLQGVVLGSVSEGLDLGIENFNRPHVQWRNEMNAVLNLLLALSAEHHARKTSGVLYTEQVYGIASSSL